jgi:anaerobic selenocysteine-containing dehydrogenase
MTNNWPDIGNATLVVAMGANPAENHPACMAHINRARAGGWTTSPSTGHPKAKLLVIDPRMTRTASQADNYVRIRPGTDIAFINGLIKYITDNISGAQKTNFLAYLNHAQGQAYLSDANISTMVLHASKYTDARIRVSGTDYKRVPIGGGGGWTVSATDLATNVTRPSIVLDGTTLKMWFVPKVGTNIQYSTSTDNGATWTVAADTDIVYAGVEDAPRVFSYTTGGVTTWYMANTDGTNITLRTASGSTGLVWGPAVTIAAPALFTTDSPSKLDAPMLIQEAAEWKLYAQGAVGTTRQIYLAKTTTMNPASWAGTFTRVPASGSQEPVLKVGGAGAFDEVRAMHPYVIKDGGAYIMTYTGLGLAGGPDDVYRLGGAQSANGIAWTKLGTNPLTGFPTDATKANTIKIGSAFYQFFTMDGAGTLRSGTSTVMAQISNFPEFAASCTEADTVYSLLRQHVAPYTSDVVANICGCSAAEIELVAQMFMDNSRCSSYATGTPTSIINEPKHASYRSTTMLYAMGITQHTHGAQNVKSFAVLQTLLGNMGRCGGGINALRGIHNVQGSTDMGLLYGNTVGYNFGQPGTQTVTLPSPNNAFGAYLDKLFGNRLTGGTAAFDNAFDRTKMGLQQRGWYNQLLAWFAPGVHGRTNVEKAWDLYPKGNGNNHIAMFRAMATGTVTKAAVVWGQNPAVTEPNQGKVRAGLENLDLLVVVDNFATETAQCHRKDTGRTYLIPSCSYVEEAGSVVNSGRVLQWREKATAPKGNSKADLELLLRFAKTLNDHGGFTHIQTQWNSMTGTGAHLSGSKDVYDVLYKDRYGWSPVGMGAFESVELLDVDIWRGESETHTHGAVYGSEAVTERIYREMASPLTTGGTVWLYLEGYDDGYRTTDWTPTDATTALTYLAAGTVTDAGTVTVTDMTGTVTYTEGTHYTVVYSTADSVTGAGKVTATVGSPLIGTGTYVVRWRVSANWTGGRGKDWKIYNRAKSRDNADNDPSGITYPGVNDANNHLMFKNWGYSWLVNRRVLYGTDLLWDQADAFQGPERCARMYTAINTGTIDYATSYRHVHGLADKPDVVQAGITSSPHYISVSPAVSLAGRFPGHTEPYETPSAALAATWGRNTSTSLAPANTKWNLVPSDTVVYAPDDVSLPGRTGTVPTEITNAATSKGLPDIAAPLVLTTIRCVEHFQGGPITRNNSYNVEAEPVPWVEINSIDARLRGIADGDWVNVVTVRSNSTTDQTAVGRMGTRYVAQPGNPADNFGKGFRARVGVGLAPNQRVGAGVVAIPWHWGDQGLSTGARANDLCIDAMDANTTIPEYKACICWITKA